MKCVIMLECFTFLTVKGNESVLDFVRTVNDGDFDASKRRLRRRQA